MRHEETKRKYQGVFIAAPTPMPDALFAQFRSWVNEIIGLLPISATA